MVITTNTKQGRETLFVFFGIYFVLNAKQEQYKNQTKITKENKKK